VPHAAGSQDCVSLFWSPTTALVGVSHVVCLKDRVDGRPGGLDCILAGEKGAVSR
jgi:hypothetical protein